MKINTKPKQPQQYTHEGAIASRINPEQQLRRSVMACMLWEDSFYESGQDIAQRIATLVPQCRPEFVAACAFHARTKMKLRHVPLLLVALMTKLPTHKHMVGALLGDVIQRADEITEFLAIYHSPVIGSRTLSAQVKKGLDRAFTKFSEYDLAKYNRNAAWKLRDALFLCHHNPTAGDGARYTRRERKQGVPRNLNEREALMLRLVNNELATPDTWEVALSTGADKRETFERLMAEKKLGALAFLRNLRNMHEAGVTKETVAAYASGLNIERVLPFRFVTAARILPAWEDVLEPLMLQCLAGQPRLPGRTILLADVSGSMDDRLSARGETTRMDAALGLGVLLREVSESFDGFTFSDRVVQVAPRRGFALRDAMKDSQPHSGTRLGEAVRAIEASRLRYDRLIVITDEQSHDRVPAPKGRGYVVNVASYKNGIGYGAWTHIDGWSEAVIDFIREYEASQI